jgi:hypothetical protein
MHWALAIAAIFYVAAPARAAEPALNVDGIKGYVFDDSKAAWETENVFDGNYASVNRLGVGLFTVVTVNIGAKCKFLMASTPGGPSGRPAYCQKPPGVLQVELAYGDGTKDVRHQSLAPFAADDDGRIHVPIFFYRKNVCVSLRVTARIRSSSKTEKVAFTCRE